MVHFVTWCVCVGLMAVAVAQRGPSNVLNDARSNSTQRQPSGRTDGYGSRNYSAADKLIKQLFDTYLDSIPVNSNVSAPLNVKIHARILRLLDIDDLKQILRFSAKFTLEWQDDRLSWSPRKHANLTRLEVPRSVAIWWPDVTWLERLEVDFLWRSQGRVTLTNHGSLMLTSQVIMNLNCYMDPGYFPFDIHRCSLTFEPIVHTKDEVILFTQLSEGVGNASLFHDQWSCSILTPNCSSSTHLYATSAASGTLEHIDNRCLLVLKRKALYHLFNLFLPASIITFMTVFAFFIPPTESDMKLQFSLSILLQLIVFLMYIYDSLPFSATQIPLLSLYFSMCLFMAAISCVLVVFIAYLNWLGENNINVPDWVDAFFIRKLGPYLVKRHLKMFYKVRKSAKVLSEASAASSASDLSERRKNRVNGVYWFGRIAVPLSVLFSQSMRFVKNINDASTTGKSSEGEGGIVPGEAGAPLRTVPHPDHAGAPAAAHPDETMSAGLRRAHSKRSAPVMDMANDKSDCGCDPDWNINKVEWSLVALILDRVCALIFVTVFFVLITTVLVIGYVSQLLSS